MVQTVAKQETVVVRGLPYPGAYSLEGTNTARPWRYYHEAYCVTVVMAGNGRWRYRRRDEDFGAHGLLLMEPGELHVTTAVHVPGDFQALFLPLELIQDLFRAQGRTHATLQTPGTESPSARGRISPAPIHLALGSRRSRSTTGTLARVGSVV